MSGTRHQDHVFDHLVVGGGLTGLTRAWRLATAGHDVALLEASTRCGGALETRVEAGYRIDTGGVAVAGAAPHLEALLAAEPAGPELTAPTPLLGWGRRGLEVLPARRPLRLRLPRGLPGFRRAANLPVRLLKGGVGRLPEALAHVLGARVHRSVKAVSLGESGTEPGLVVIDAQGRGWRARSVALALPAVEQARLLESVTPHHAASLAALPHRSLVRIAVGFLGPPPPSPLAFVRRPGAPGRLGRAVATSSWEAGRAPPGCWLLQAAVTGAEAPGVTEWSDGALERMVVADLRRALGRLPPIDALGFTRHEGAVPAPLPGHRRRLAEMQAALGDRGILLLGDHVLGSGLDRRCVPGAPTHAPVLEGVELV